ncbi:MAG: AsmA family protein [Elusimicrobia bacterium]|nr:AsmA family protein [Elusimicrobiota bacterium]
MRISKEITKRIRKVARRLGKWVLRLFGLLLIFAVLVVSVATVTLKAMFTPEHLKSVLTDQLQQVFKRPVHMDHVQIMFFRGVRVRGLRILESPDFPGRDFISSELLVARLQLLPLLRKKIILSELELIAPRIVIIRTKKGTWNFSDIATSSTTQGGIPVMAWTVHRAQVRDGTLIYEDVPLDLKHAVTGFNLRVTGFGLWGEFPFEVSFISKNKIQGEKLDARFALEGWMDLAGLNWAKATLREGEIRSTIERKYLEARFSVHGFSNPQIDVQVDIPAFKSQDVPAILKFPPGWSFAPIRWNVRTNIAGSSQLSFSSAIRMGSLQLAADGNLDFSASSPTVRLHGATNIFSMEDVARVWSELSPYRLAGRAQLQVNLAGPFQDMSIRKIFISLSGARGTQKDFRASGVDLLFSAIDDFRQTSWRISRGEIRSPEQSWTHIRAGGKLLEDVFTVSDGRAIWNNIPLRLSLQIKPFFSAQRRLDLKLFLEKLDLDKTIKLMSSLKPSEGTSPVASSRPRHKLWWLRTFKRSLPRGFPSLAGELELKKITHPYFTGDHFRASWDLKGVSPGVKKLEGIVRVDWGPGIVRNIPRLSQQEKILRVIFLPFTVLGKLNGMGVLKVSEEFDLPYDKIHGEYAFHFGVMEVRPFFVDSPDVSAVSQGKVDWVSENLDLRVLARVNKTSKLGSYPETLTDEKGRPTIGFSIDGPMTQPAVKPHLKKVESGIIERIMEQTLRGEAQNLTPLFQNK